MSVALQQLALLGFAFFSFLNCWSVRVKKRPCSFIVDFDWIFLVSKRKQGAEPLKLFTF